MQTGARAPAASSVSSPAAGVLVTGSDFVDVVGSSGAAPCHGRWERERKTVAVAPQMLASSIHMHARMGRRPRLFRPGRGCNTLASGEGARQAAIIVCMYKRECGSCLLGNVGVAAFDGGCRLLHDYAARQHISRRRQACACACPCACARARALVHAHVHMLIHVHMHVHLHMRSPTRM